MGEPFIVCQNLVKIYKIEDLEVFALQGLDLEIKRGELMAIIGSSGSGKSTLLNVLGGLDTPTAGRAYVAGWDLLRMSNRARVLYKRDTVGFVWQNVSRNLVPYLSALENVELPMILAGRFDRNRAKELLAAVGLEKRMRHKPVHMSGGEQQRVAIAIALANNPSVLLADEPTGSLDSRTAQTVLQAFRQVRDLFGVTIVVVTHDRSMSNAVDRFVEIRDGKTSTEAVRRDLAEGRVAETTHDQYTLLDSAGRLQLPLSYVENLGLQGPSRVRLTVEGQRIIIEPPNADAPPLSEEPA
ncbi:MAG: ATP-binding cassette domain-containing protein [Limnochordia bacterium]